MLAEPNLMSARDRLHELCRLIEADELGVVDGCRQIVALQTELDEVTRGSPDLVVIVAVESETDAFPIGPARAAWSNDALEQVDRDLGAYLAKVSTDVKAACRRLRTSTDKHE